ncbi:Hypothetical protein NTJ_14627 [Nesidiocoris tenuis]|uniref:Transmembrane protein n=1 Tax=Nesidiocoris tenuis TaxID=355587 RepID=A0ABN7BDQ8_9HEMI|nr:Hypothetical protein NTJ_14627 [Nesidiocoris tenuis]
MASTAVICTIAIANPVLKYVVFAVGAAYVWALIGAALDPKPFEIPPIVKMGRNQTLKKFFKSLLEDQLNATSYLDCFEDMKPKGTCRQISPDTTGKERKRVFCPMSLDDNCVRLSHQRKNGTFFKFIKDWADRRVKKSWKICGCLFGHYSCNTIGTEWSKRFRAGYFHPSNGTGDDAINVAILNGTKFPQSEEDDKRFKRDVTHYEDELGETCSFTTADKSSKLKYQILYHVIVLASIVAVYDLAIAIWYVILTARKQKSAKYVYWITWQTVGVCLNCTLALIYLAMLLVSQYIRQWRITVWVAVFFIATALSASISFWLLLRTMKTISKK